MDADMMKYDLLLNSSLTRYIRTLEYYGYIKDLSIDKLLILSYIQEILSGAYEINISEAEYFLIRRAVLCLMGSDCLIPYIEYASERWDNITHPSSVRANLRETEDASLRSTESLQFRIVENENLLS